jgi:drug/metabolite transporter (DMT)-like permease
MEQVEEERRKVVSQRDHDDTRRYRLTIGLLLFVVILWGINVVMIKYLTLFFPPLALAPIRLFLATCLLVPLVIKKYGFSLPERSAWLPMIGVAIFSIVLHHIALSWGISATSATHAALILGLNPLLTAILASRVIHEPLTWPKGIGILLGFGGVLFVVIGKETGAASIAGDLIMFLAMAAAVIGSLFIKKSTETVAPLLVTAYTHAAASLGLLVFGVCVNPIWVYPDAFQVGPIAVLLFSSFVNTALGAWWWNMGIQKIGASKSALFQNGIPVAGVFASVCFLGESLHIEHILALIFVIFAVLLGTGILTLKSAQDKKQQNVMHNS